MCDDRPSHGTRLCWGTKKVKNMSFIFNLNNCQPRKPTNICIPTLVRYLVKYERFLGVPYIQIHQSTLTQSGWLNVLIGQWRVLVEYVDFFLAWKTNFANRQPGVPGQNGHGRRQWVQELMSWTGRVCYALFYVCIALKNIWFPFKWNRLYGIMDTREEVFSRPRHFFARVEVFTLCFVLSVVLRLDAEHTENKPNVGRRRVY